MKLFTQRIEKTATNLPDVTQLKTLSLPFDVRQKSRFRSELTDGEAVAVDLPRTSILRDGDVISIENPSQDDDFVVITSAPQEVMCVKASADAENPAFELMCCAYHLGNRHVPLMLTKDALYFEPDHVLKDMLIGLGAVVTDVAHPFEPETGAYSGDGQGHSHSHTHSHSHSHSHGHTHNNELKPENFHPQDLIKANFQFMG